MDLKDLSQHLTQLIERLGPSVVRVDGHPRRTATGVVWSADGHVLTSHHAIAREADEVRVGLADGRELSARLLGRDPALDLALLKIDATGLAPLTRAPEDAVRVGTLALALGRPGKTLRATFGIVSAAGGAWRTPWGGKLERYLESDVDLPPGFGGAPVVDMEGRLIGLASSALSRTGAVLLPAEALERAARALTEHGGTRRGYLGVGAYPVRLPEKLAQAHGTRGGLILLSVEPGGPADRAGMQLGDTLLTLEGEPLLDVGDLLAQLSPERVGQSVRVKVLRAGAVQEVTLTVVERP